MTTTTPPTASDPTTPTRSSVETTAASSGETDGGSSPSQKKWHGNRKREYPFYKPCEGCSMPLECLNRTQAKRSRFCRACLSVKRRAPRKKKALEDRIGVVRVTCSVCGKEIWRPRAHVRVKNPMCSRKCNGVLRGEDWKKYAHLGRAGWTQESKASFREKMSGASNPSWKGGVTFKRSKGNYVGPKYVRCPSAFMGMARKDGYVMEHRLVVAQAMGRCLTRTEAVHHIDHDTRNNAPSNLMLFRTNGDHKLYEARGTPEPLWRG
jgi:hypothetical protein